MQLPFRPRTALIAIAVIAVSFVISLKAMDWLSPGAVLPKAAEVDLPPLPPASRASFVMVPVSIALAAIRDAADRATPRNFSGKAENPMSQVLQNADIGWTASRGPISASVPPIRSKVSGRSWAKASCSSVHRTRPRPAAPPRPPARPTGSQRRSPAPIAGQATR